jgi:hypothetical protein
MRYDACTLGVVIATQAVLAALRRVGQFQSLDQRAGATGRRPGEVARRGAGESRCTLLRSAFRLR